MAETRSDTDSTAVREQDYPAAGTLSAQLRFLIHYAVLAPSSHNSQPWKFHVRDDRVALAADLSRWLKVADPEQRELHVSLGCALENLLIAAEHFGLAHQLELFPASGPEAAVALVRFAPGGTPAPFRGSGLFHAIAERYTARQPYDDLPVRAVDLQRLHACVREPDVYLDMTPDETLKAKFIELTRQADVLHLADPEYRKELGRCIGEGAFGHRGLRAWLERVSVRFGDFAREQSRKDTAALKSSPLVAALSSRADDAPSQVRVGQVFERIALTATEMGIHVHPMSQALEIPALRAELAALLPAQAIPQHLFRLGYGAEESVPHTPRRPLEEVLA